MESMLVDLREQRCPMALLLAKRYVAQYFQEETQQCRQLVIQVVEQSAKRDIVKYLCTQGYAVRCESAIECFTLTVWNKEPTNHA